MAKDDDKQDEKVPQLKGCKHNLVYPYPSEEIKCTRLSQAQEEELEKLVKEKTVKIRRCPYCTSVDRE